MPTLRTLVTFQSTSFNTTESREDFINPDNYGDDLARFLMDALRTDGVTVPDYLGQEDHGWFFTFEVNGTEHDLVVGWADGEWIAWIERRTGLLASLLGRRRHGILPEAVEAVHSVLSSSPEISDARWHLADAYQSGDTGSGVPDPLG